jgi:N-methylhydantoinase A
VPKIRMPAKPAGGTLAAARLRTDKVVFRVGVELKPFETAFYDRAKLPVGEAFPGPAIILQVDSTTVVPPGCTAEVHASGSIILSQRGEKVS